MPKPSHHHGGTADILSRLERVKQTGPGRWLALCPAHADKSPSLSIRETDDGRTLCHCFSGCSVDAVVGAVGLELTDLFPPKPVSYAKPLKRPFPADDVLRGLALEATVVLAAARDMLEAGDLSLGFDGFERLALAHERIQSAVTLAGGRGHV